MCKNKACRKCKHVKNSGCKVQFRYTFIYYSHIRAELIFNFFCRVNILRKYYNTPFNLSHIFKSNLLLCFFFPLAVGRKNTLAWCVENGFELVELEPEPDSEDEGLLSMSFFICGRMTLIT